MEFKDVVLEFANKNLTDFFRITDIRDPLADNQITTIKIPGKDGELFTGSEVGVRRIEVDFTIENDDVRAIELELAPYLNIREPVKLKFSREPNKYYFAIIEGLVRPERIASSIETGTLIFLCPDPYAFSETIKSFPMDANKQITITNGGTAKTQVNYNVEVSGDCGFVSIISPTGTILYGKPKEVDSIAQPRSRRLLSDSFTSVGTWSQNAGTVFTPGALIGGSVTSIDGKLAPADFGTGSAWHGTTASKSLSESALNFDAVIQFEFGVNGAKLTKGILEMSFIDATGSIMFGQQIKDAFEGFDNAVPGMYIDNVMRHVEKDIAPKQSKPKAYNTTATAYGTTTATSEDGGAWNKLHGTLEVSKMGSSLIFKLTKRNSSGSVVYKLVKSFRLTATQQAQQLQTVGFWFGQWASSTAIQMAVNSIIVTKHNTAKAIDIPNILQSGDKLTINSRSSQVYLNNSLAMENLDPFSWFHESEPGIMVVNVMSSNDSVINVTAEITERFL